MPKVLLLGGKGHIGSGLRTYLPRLDASYEITTIDLPDSEDKATQPDAQQNFIDFDINEDPGRLSDCAKGQNLVAQKIKEIARENDIPCVENKPLAQTLFKAVEVGQEIPQDLYKAVAEVLAYVFKLRGDTALKS